MSDRIFGLVCLALAAGYLFLATTIQLPFLSDPIGPRVFPYIIGGLTVLAALVPVLKPDPDPEWPALSGIGEIAFAVVIMVAYTYALKEIGFVVSTAFASAALSWRLGSKPHWALIAGIFTAAAIYAVFHLILGLSLARGPWGF
ncbi:MAG: tripartite tricarboxylate transporter TctB family protein [Oricola sp.]